METQIETGSTATPALPETETPTATSNTPTEPTESAAEIVSESAPADATTAVPAAPQACKHCGLEGKHVEPVEPVACNTCERQHGATAEVLDRATGKLVERRVIVTHSLEGVRRENGQTGEWRPQPICTLCIADLKCRTYDAQKATPKGQRKPWWPNFWALRLAIEEAEKLNAQDAERAAQRERDREVQPRFDREVEARGEGFRKAVLYRLRQNRSTGLAAALDAELAVLAPLDALVKRYGSWARGVVFAHMRDARCSLEAAIEAMTAAIEAEGKAQLRRKELLARGYNLTSRFDGKSSDRRGPRREASGGERDGGGRPDKDARRQRRDDGERHEARGPQRDKRGNPNLGGRGYVTPDDL